MRAGPRECLEGVRDAVATVLGVEPDSVAVHVPLRELGIDSVGLTRLTAAIGERLDAEVPSWAVWQCPTVATLAEFLSDGSPRAPAGRASRSANPATEPVAIVGMGCRLPGGIDSPERLWAALRSEVDAVGTVPADRWNAGEWYDPDQSAPGKTTTDRGGFLDDITGFDAAFFRVSPAEAERMDPQQRIALEVVWAALEDARIVPAALSGTRTGVFFGTMWQEYHLATGADPAGIGPHSAVGWDTSIVPSRIAYVLGLQGPVLSVGSACSSSLGAVHLAAHSLRRGESDIALAGGVSLMLHPHTTVAMTKFGGLNPDGQCRAFDADAAGYVRSEGCGVVVLRRLSDALRDGDRIYAVLRGSAVNNDGASNGLTAPNPRAQVDVLRTAWAEAGVRTDQVSYVEAHGTGTPLGDLIEASALGEVFGPGRTEPLRIGSAKTNFGHLEPAAGVLGVLKTALALHHGELPASLHFDRPNPEIDFVGQKLAVVTERQSWPVGPRYAGVSAFGFGGTNVHVALEQAPHRRRRLLAVAADTEPALRARLAAVSTAGDIPMSPGPGHHRAVAWLDGCGDPAATARVAQVGDRPKVVFCFSGHGAQWLGMGAGLLAEPVFRAAIEDVDRALAPVTGWSVLDELLAPRLDRADVVQPALFAVQVALTRLLAAWGVSPDVVFGQSVGEVAAAVATGALFLDQGAELIGRWSRLVAERASGSGSMIVCDLPAAAADRISRGRLSIAAAVAEDWTCLSGSTGALVEVERDLAQAGATVRRVAIDYPAHSTELAAITPDLVAELAGLRAGQGTIPFLSTVTGGPLPGTRLDAGYWARNTCQPMRLTEVAAALPADAQVVEIGPHPVLAQPMRRLLAPGSRVLAACHRDVPARQTVEDLLAELWLSGVEVDWAAATGVPAPTVEPVPLTVSSATRTGLRAQAAAMREHLAAHPEQSLAEVGHSLVATRSMFDHRAVVLAADRDQATSGLDALAAGVPHPGLVTAATEPVRDTAGPVLVFPGQGSQWTGMARELLADSPVFAARFAECAAALDEFVEWSLIDVLADEAALARADVVQPALWAVMVSLARLWEAHGLRPTAVVGHSQGEIAAACVGGALSLRDAARVVASRARVIADTLSGSGGMVSVALPRDEAAERAGGWDRRLSVAAELGPRSTVLAGPDDALEGLMTRCAEAAVVARRVAIDYPSHSPGVDPARAEVLAALTGVEPQPAELTHVSTVTGKPLAGVELDADYWYRNLREPVELRAVVDLLLDRGHRVFVEASPHPVLSPGIEETAAARGLDVVAVASVRRGDGGLSRFLTSVTEAHVRGVDLDWALVLSSAGPVDLPTYQFQRRDYWPRVDRRSGAADPADAEFWGAVERGDLGALRDTLNLPADATLADLLPALARWRRERIQPEVPEPAPEPAPAALVELLAGQPPARRLELVTDVVLRNAAAVLGYRGDEPAAPERAFRELGFDSVSGLDLRNRLAAELGLALPPTLVYDQPTPAALAGHLLAELDLDSSAPDPDTAVSASIADAADDELFDLIDSLTSRRTS
ncbi:type I polyketide synthase [Amycolatopsis antarctica]|uniref:type I polyketide synthase n=1 Tax=Amycolatopsis antarctica TaxID=1854586 RepID=UPI001056C516|nr:type I polyketide synthase [Amycolatopsis antarctica]